MDWIWILVFVILWLVGLIGCFVPVLPGSPIAFVGILAMQFSKEPPFSTWALVLWGLFILFITILDYWVPAYGTKIFGGSKWGSNGALIGMFVGMFTGFFAGPLGLFIGAFVGAFIGEIMYGKNEKDSLTAAFGSFLGFLAGVVIKVVSVFMLLIYFFMGLFF